MYSPEVSRKLSKGQVMDKLYASCMSTVISFVAATVNSSADL
jgi:hypothetical protein